MGQHCLAQQSRSNRTSRNDTQTHCWIAAIVLRNLIGEYELGDGLDVGELNLMRVIGHRTCVNTQFSYLTDAAKNKDKLRGPSSVPL